MTQEEAGLIIKTFTRRLRLGYAAIVPNLIYTSCFVIDTLSMLKLIKGGNLCFMQNSWGWIVVCWATFFKSLLAEMTKIGTLLSLKFS